MAMKKQNSTVEKSYSWCPECKRWVPSNYFLAEYDKVDDVLTRMCFHCATLMSNGEDDLPEFDWSNCVYDPDHDKVKCPFCGQRREDHTELNSRAKFGDADYRKWRCGNPLCNREFKLLI